jgi:mono/diheme cytochrome c family protein
MNRLVQLLLALACSPSGTRAAVGFCLSALCSIAVAADEPVDFREQIAPIFEKYCVRCHSPGNEKGDVSLATFEDLKSKEYVLAGDPDGSYLIELVTPQDGEPPAMPREAKPLADAEVDLLRHWIAQGAKWPNGVIVKEKAKADASWWAYQPLRSGLRQESLEKNRLPESGKESSGGFHSIDDFIRAKLAEKELTLNPPADRRVLIRRATYDLIGLPPTPEEVEAFENDPDPKAYERLIDRLLDSPHYGERWGRHWLDVVRFGESIGYERNVIINDIWPFRDYVIRSINEDKPFNQFIREHIAGDVSGTDDPEVMVGSAFLVAGPYDDVGNQDPVQAAQIRANTLDEIISATGEAFLGMTLGCARCHNHKFDPITQEDYYGLYATFSGVRHGSVPLATPEQHQARAAKLRPLNERKASIEKSLAEFDATLLKRARSKLAEYETAWTRTPVDRTGTEDHFEPVTAKFVRLVCEAQDGNPNLATGFGIDEFEVWATEKTAGNVALSRNGGRATGSARTIEDFPGAYGPQHAIDGKTGARFLATGPDLTIELARPTLVDRVVFSSARNESTPDHRKFTFVAEYRIEVSVDGEQWQVVSSSRDRRPIPRPALVNHRLLQLEATAEDRAEKQRLSRELTAVNREIAQIPALPSVWIGRRVDADARGPFHVFLGGSPQKKGDAVTPASLEVFRSERRQNSLSIAPAPMEAKQEQESRRVGSTTSPSLVGPSGFHYQLAADAPESERRLAFANWLVHTDNPLTPRVLANRLWHYHFGTGIVDTPSDFGYKGGRPTHPGLLDFLALKLKENGWRIKAMHRLIMLSDTYQQSSSYREAAAGIDGESRLLWRFPPRRLSAEEVRDTMLMVAGKLHRVSSSFNGRPKATASSIAPNTDVSGLPLNDSAVQEMAVPDGGPGFRLYHFMQDNVCTYVPLDRHGPETYRRAVYHQNARASVVDLMTEFDQPDCTFSAPRRAETTTPLQALTMLNHSFTLDMAAALAERLKREAGGDVAAQVDRACRICYSRSATEEEASACRQLVDRHGLAALCRVLLNTSEMIHVQ